MGYEKTLVLLKPDAVRRKLVGRIIDRLESADLDILDIRMFNPATPELISNHYRSTDKWLIGVGNKTRKSYLESGKSLEDLHREFGAVEPIDVGRVVKNRLMKFMTGGPLVAMIIGGNHAIKKVRSLAGYTIPAEATPGTIRADFSSDSPDYATSRDRSVENIIHASGNAEEADYEMMLWFQTA